MAKNKEFTTHIDSDLDDAWIDQSHVAKTVLNQVIHDDDPLVATELANQVDAEAEKQAPSILSFDSGRTAARVLFITTETTVLEKGTMAEKQYLDLAQWLDEVHVMIVAPKRLIKNSTERISTNVWVYGISAADYTASPQAVLDRVSEELVFNDSLRPDIIVATDALTSGWAAKAVAEAYDRVWQLHLKRHVFGTKLQPAQLSFWERRIVKKVLRSVPSIRYSSAEIKHSVTAEAAVLAKDQKVLPQFYNFDAFRQGKPVFNLHERYPEYKLIMLAFGTLTADSDVHDLFIALRNILYKNRIGLILIADGPAKKLFVEKVKLLGIEQNVVFVSVADEITSYYKTADVLVETGVDTSDDEVILRALAARLPVVAYETELRLDLLEDGTSALLCSPGDQHCLSQKMVSFINNQALRTKFRRQMETIADTRLHEDKQSYYEALRDTIEIALIPATEQELTASDSETLVMPKVIANQTS